jgi:FtsH-binding integral membrane protein
MKIADRSPVSQVQFYGALSIVWLFIMLLLGGMMRPESRWALLLLWAVSFLMVIAYSVCVFLACKAQKKPDDGETGD